MKDLSQSEQIIRRLYQVTSDYQKGFDIQVLQLIMLGLEEYKLDIGIFSKITNHEYEIVHCIAPEGVELSTGDSFDYEKTYCELTCRSHKPIAVEHAGNSKEYANHPAYQELKLESYIGVPIYLNDELYGTLNFSSSRIRDKQFTSMEIDLIYLMGTWIESELVRHKQERELLLLNEKLEYQANYDVLTGLPNRRYLFNTLNEQMEKICLDDGEGTLVLMDIDYFKSINDKFGHQKGDDILKNVATKLKHCLTGDDFIGRFGGEEFVVWLSPSSMSIRCKKIERLMCSINDIILNDKVLTLSAGVCHFTCQNGQNLDSKKTVDALISYADRALYEAKSSGRNRTNACQKILGQLDHTILSF